jgi:hypothetical protein
MELINMKNFHDHSRVFLFTLTAELICTAVAQGEQNTSHFEEMSDWPIVHMYRALLCDRATEYGPHILQNIPAEEI